MSMSIRFVPEAKQQAAANNIAVAILESVLRALDTSALSGSARACGGGCGPTLVSATLAGVREADSL